MSLQVMVLVCAGGALGAVGRYWITRMGDAMFRDTSFPIPTLFVNLLGSLGLGVLFGVVDPDLTAMIEAPVLLFFGVGFCGAFTTFSSFCTETVGLFGESPAMSGVYVASTLGGCVALFALPMWAMGAG